MTQKYTTPTTNYKVGLAKISNNNGLLETTTKKTYTTGNLSLFKTNGTLEYKIWSEAIPEKFLDHYNNNQKYFKIQYTEESYKNSPYIVIKEFIPMTDDEVKQTFLKAVLKEQADLVDELNLILNKNVSNKGIELVEKFKELNPEIYNRFIIEQAAIGKHDATPVGLLRHTLKMLKFLELTLSIGNQFYLNQDGKDLLYIGLLLHDIGKVKEYYEGEATNLAKVTHRGLGIEIAVLNKDLFIETYDEDWYYELIAIINQHHGVYEERPHSFFSYFVHLVDMYDTHTTGMLESLISNQNNPTMRVLDRDIPILVKEPKYFSFEEGN